MLRYVKVNNTWIDTLAEQRDNHITYMIIDSLVISIDALGNETVVGKPQEESDERMPL